MEHLQAPSDEEIAYVMSELMRIQELKDKIEQLNGLYETGNPHDRRISSKISLYKKMLSNKEKKLNEFLKAKPALTSHLLF